jgi:hypothetical protein
MPSKPGKDDEVFVKLFVSAYENGAWAGAHIDVGSENRWRYRGAGDENGR